MKTIAELATELNVTPQAIYKKIKQFKQPLKDHLNKGDRGQTLIDSEGQAIIKDSFKQFKQPFNETVQQQFKQPFNAENGEIIKLLQDNINVLQKQLEIKDKQIEELTATVKTQAESINIDRKNELAGTLIDGQKQIEKENQNIEPMEPEPQKEPEEKTGFFNKIFGKRK